MPRKRVVSRVVRTTTAYCLMINTKTKEQFRKSFTLCGTKDRAEINRRGEKLFSDGSEKFVNCDRVKHDADFYSMPEEDFIKLATKTKREKEKEKN